MTEAKIIVWMPEPSEQTVEKPFTFRPKASTPQKVNVDFEHKYGAPPPEVLFNAITESKPGLLVAYFSFNHNLSISKLGRHLHNAERINVFNVNSPADLRSITSLVYMKKCLIATSLIFQDSLLPIQSRSTRAFMQRDYIWVQDYIWVKTLHPESGAQAKRVQENEDEDQRQGCERSWPIPTP